MDSCQHFMFFFSLDLCSILTPTLVEPHSTFVHDNGDEQPNTHDLLGGCRYKSHKQKMELIVQGCRSAVIAAAAAC